MWRTPLPLELTRESRQKGELIQNGKGCSLPAMEEDGWGLDSNPRDSWCRFGDGNVCGIEKEDYQFESGRCRGVLCKILVQSDNASDTLPCWRQRGGPRRRLGSVKAQIVHRFGPNQLPKPANDVFKVWGPKWHSVPTLGTANAFYSSFNKCFKEFYSMC